MNQWHEGMSVLIAEGLGDLMAEGVHLLMACGNGSING